MAGEKTERATDKRRKDERKKGNVFQSKEVVTVVGILAVFFTLQAIGPLILTALQTGITDFWAAAGTVHGAFTMPDVQRFFVRAIMIYGVSAMPTLLVAGFVAFLFTIIQTRGLFSAKSFTPKFSRLSPAKGIKKIFSARGVVELLKSILKIIVLGNVIFSKYKEHFAELPGLMQIPFQNVIFYAGGFLMEIVTNVVAIFAFLAAADYIFQRWQYEKDLRMSKQELKEEYKQTEGDPAVKAKIREKQRQMSQARMMANVPNADVVIRNPTHYAVAIKYNPEENRAPIVIAKGADLVALRIIRVADENDVMLVENRPLARSLYEEVPLDREVPEEFYQTVAEVLAFVYSTQKKHLPKDVQNAPPS